MCVFTTGNTSDLGWRDQKSSFCFWRPKFPPQSSDTSLRIFYWHLSDLNSAQTMNRQNPTHQFTYYFTVFILDQNLTLPNAWTTFTVREKSIFCSFVHFSQSFVEMWTVDGRSQNNWHQGLAVLPSFLFIMCNVSKHNLVIWTVRCRPAVWILRSAIALWKSGHLWEANTFPSDLFKTVVFLGRKLKSDLVWDIWVTYRVLFMLVFRVFTTEILPPNHSMEKEDAFKLSVEG